MAQKLLLVPDMWAGGREGGFILAIVLTFLIVLSIVALLATRLTRTDVSVVNNIRNEKKAFYAAEAGLAEALLRLNAAAGAIVTANGRSFDARIVPDGGDPAWRTLILEGSFAPTKVGSLFSTPTTQQADRALDYTTSVDSGEALTISWDPDGSGSIRRIGGRNVLRVVSTGRAGPARRTVTGLVSQLSRGACAILADDDVVIAGNPSLRGEGGCVHTNAILEILGNPTLESEATSTAEMTIRGVPTIDGNRLNGRSKNEYIASHQYQPEVPIPDICPLEFGDADLDLARMINELPVGGYRLDSDCRVYTGGTWTCSKGLADCSGGLEIADLNGGGQWAGWDCAAAASVTPGTRWKMSGSVGIPGAFLVEGWVDITGNAGSLLAPWAATIVALNTISISGTPNMVPYTDAGSLRNVLFVSGNDLELGGNLGGATRPAAMFAHQQVKFRGNPELVGFVIAENGRSTCTADPAPDPDSGKNIVDTNSIAGNFGLTYDPADNDLYVPGSVVGGNGYQVIAWSDF